jgi:alkylation response protein AidB-like acyl-CoA dehydrogenase
MAVTSSMNHFNFPFAPSTEAENSLRAEVREFLQDEIKTGGFTPGADCWMSESCPEFSAKLGARGWLGMVWPKKYGGHERSPLERLVVTEELLAAGAPVAAHWIADRQTGTQILRFGSEQQRQSILPRMAAGTCFAAIGMSEPQAGSDLAAVQTKADKIPTGWRLSGRKIWSTGAHRSDYMIVLARTSPADGRNRQVGLSQFLVPLQAQGVEISGIKDIAGNVHFNETLFDGVELEADALLGLEGNGWAQCMGELVLERSGPERFLSNFVLLDRALISLRGQLDKHGAAILGELITTLNALRLMSRSIARQLENGLSPDTEAALVKLIGNSFEQDVVTRVRQLLSTIPRDQWPDELAPMLDQSIFRLPPGTLRGGTSEILRGMIARQLGMR